MDGNVISNLVNSPSLDDIDKVPLCAFTISCVIDKPRPVPSFPFFVVKKGSKILFKIGSGMPAPLSSISVTILLLVCLVLTRSYG